MRIINLKNLSVSILILSLMAPLGCSTTPGARQELTQFTPRPHKSIMLENGLKVTVVEDASLPLISLSLLVKAGATSDPKGLEGLSSFTAQLLDKGTKKRNEEKLTEELSEYAADFASTTNEDFSLFSMSALTFHRERLFKDFVEIITEPQFSKVEIERFRRRLTAKLKSVADEPRQVADLGFDEFLFGSHPYARFSTGRITTVKSIQRAQIVAHYKALYQPSNSHLLIVGQVSTEDLQNVKKLFGAWRGITVAQPKLADAELTPNREILVIDKADLKQSQIRFGHLGIRRNDPDFVPLRVATTILGGGFTSRLMREVREKRGLTYAIWSYFDARLERGAFEISTFSRNEKVGETLTEVLRVVAEMKEKGVSEKEVRDAVSYLKGQFPQALETAEAFGTQLLYLDLYGVPDSYFTTYLSDLDKLSASDIQRVINKHWHPEALKVVVHGPKDAVVPQVHGIAPVKVKDTMSLLQ